MRGCRYGSRTMRTAGQEHAANPVCHIGARIAARRRVAIMLRATRPFGNPPDRRQEFPAEGPACTLPSPWQSLARVEARAVDRASRALPRYDRNGRTTPPCNGLRGYSAAVRAMTGLPIRWLPRILPRPNGRRLARPKTHSRADQAGSVASRVGRLRSQGRAGFGGIVARLDRLLSQTHGLRDLCF